MRATALPSASCFLLNRKVFELPVVIWIVHLENRDRAARTTGVDSLEARIEFDDVRPSGHRQECNRLLLVEIEHSHQFISLAGKEGAVMLRVKSHPVVSFASADRIPPDDFVRRGIDDRENVLVLQVHVHLAGDGIVLRHPGLTVEMQSLDDFVLGHVHDRFGLSSLIGDVELVKRSRVRASIRFCLRLQFLNDLHLLQIDDADRVVAGV